MKTLTCLYTILFAVGLIGSISVSAQQTSIPITAVSFPKEVIPLDGGTIDFYARLTDFQGIIPYGGGEPYFFAQRDSIGHPWQMGFNSNDGLANGGLTGFGTYGGGPYGYNTGTGYYCNNCWTYEQILGNGQVSQWHHYRIEWNKNGVAPFNDTTRRMAIYVDDVLNSQQWLPLPYENDVAEMVGGTLNLISTGNPGKGTLSGMVAIDEFKIYDLEGNLLLWNSLGSETEVTNSIIGPNGSYNGGGNAHFVTGIVGNAVEANPVSGFGSPSSCAVPTNLLVTNITSSSAKLNWDAVAGAEGYKVRYRVSGTSQWTVKNANGNSKNLNNLSSNTNYTWEVKTFCTINPGFSSDWSAKQKFTTGTVRMGDESEQQTSFQIYPNPAKDYATIQFTLAQTSNVSIKVFDVSGKEVEALLDADLQQGEHSLPINTRHFSEGVYMVRMVSDFGIQNQKLIVQ